MESNMRDRLEMKLPSDGPDSKLEDSLYWGEREMDALNGIEFHARHFWEGAKNQSISGLHLRGLRTTLRAARECSARALANYDRWREERFRARNGSRIPRMPIVTEPDEWQLGRRREHGEAQTALRDAEPGAFDGAFLIQKLGARQLDREVPEWPFRILAYGAATTGVLERIHGADTIEMLGWFAIAGVSMVGKWLPMLARGARAYPKEYFIVDDGDMEFPRRQRSTIS